LYTPETCNQFVTFALRESCNRNSRACPIGFAAAGCFPQLNRVRVRSLQSALQDVKLSCLELDVGYKDELPVEWKLVGASVTLGHFTLPAAVITMDIPHTETLAVTECELRTAGLSRLVLTNAARLKTLEISSGGHLAVEPECLARLHTLESLQVCNRSLQDSHVSALKRLRRLCVTSARFFTGSSLASMPHLHTLTVSNCYTLTDSSLQLCTQVTTLTLKSCDAITDAGLVGLTHLVNLSLVHCYEITDAAFVDMSRLMSLQVDGCDGIAFSSVRFLNLQTLQIANCAGIAPDAFQHINGVRTLEMTASSVANAALANLVHNGQLHTVILQLLDDVTANGFACLRGISCLIVERCYHFADRSLRNLATLERLYLCDGLFAGSFFTHLVNLRELHFNAGIFTCKPKALASLSPLDLLWADSMPVSWLKYLKGVRSLHLGTPIGNIPGQFFDTLVLNGLKRLEIVETAGKEALVCCFMDLVRRQSMRSLHTFRYVDIASQADNIAELRHTLTTTTSVIWKGLSDLDPKQWSAAPRLHSARPL
jgi:hypothetical protein